MQVETRQEQVYRPGDTFVAVDMDGKARRWRILQDGEVEATDWVSPDQWIEPSLPAAEASGVRPVYWWLRWILITWAVIGLVAVTYTFRFAPNASDLVGTVAGTGTVMLLGFYAYCRRNLR